MNNSTHHFTWESLVEWATSCLKVLKVEEEAARLVASSLVQTSLWGIDSHGIARMPHYLRRISAGSVNPRPKMKFKQTGASTGQLEGDHGQGIVVCHRAMREAIALAKESGLGAVGVHNSSHCGAIGLYGRQATQEGLIGFALTHSDAFVAPHGGRRKFVGTNPICLAVPTEDANRPICLDMATSKAPWNRVVNARRENCRLDADLALDKDGQPTSDPHTVACLLPAAGYKGMGLALLIDLLCGPLNGMPYGPHVTAMYGDYSEHRRLGSFMMAIDPMRFAGGRDLMKSASQLADELRRQPRAEEATEILAPGDPEYRFEEERLATGIPVEAGLWREMSEWSARLGVDEPSVDSAAILS